METFVTVSRDHGWGKALVKHRKSLASIVEGRFRETEIYFSGALPGGKANAKRGRRSLPDLSGPPDEVAVRRCETLLAFVGEVRFSSNYGGFASARSKLLESLGDQLDLYVEELLDLLKTGEAQNEANVRAYVSIAANFSGQVRDEKAADLVRRRAASAVAPPPVDLVASLIAGS
jgi:hypothetical protein